MEDRQSPEEVLATLVRDVEAVRGATANLAPAELHMAMGALRALAATGAVSAAEAERWRSRLEREGERVLKLPEIEALKARLFNEIPPPAAPDELRRRARRLMQETLEEIVAAREIDRWHERETRYSAAHRAYGALDALSLAGLVEDADHPEWKERIYEALDMQAGGPQVVQAPAVVEAAEVKAELRAATPREPPRMRVQPAGPVFRGDRLRKTLIVEAEERCLADRPYLVELYEDGVVVHRMVPVNADDASRFSARIELSDDVGTEYRFAEGGGGNRGANRLKYEYVFVPAAPPHAARLELTLESELWIIPLAEPKRAHRSGPQ